MQANKICNFFFFLLIIPTKAKIFFPVLCVTILFFSCESKKENNNSNYNELYNKIILDKYYENDSILFTPLYNCLFKTCVNELKQENYLLINFKYFNIKNFYCEESELAYSVIDTKNNTYGVIKTDVIKIKSEIFQNYRKEGDNFCKIDSLKFIDLSNSNEIKEINKILREITNSIGVDSSKSLVMPLLFNLYQTPNLSIGNYINQPEFNAIYKSYHAPFSYFTLKDSMYTKSEYNRFKEKLIKEVGDNEAYYFLSEFGIYIYVLGGENQIFRKLFIPYSKIPIVNILNIWKDIRLKCP